jgi:hypothetical protein
MEKSEGLRSLICGEGQPTIGRVMTSQGEVGKIQMGGPQEEEAVKLRTSMFVFYLPFS